MDDIYVSLNEEVRCDFKITTKIKKLWSYQIEIMKEIERICKKLKIRYFAGGGTMLGAIRHKGFIPWDDDIDLMMFREDYEIFCKAAPYELKSQFFLQSAYTENDYGCPHIKVRNSTTTGATKYDFGFKYNKGIFVDIFPLDNIPDDDDEFHQMCENIKREQRKVDIAVRQFFYVGNEIISDKEKEECKSYIDEVGVYRAYQAVERECTRYMFEKTKRVCCLAFHLNDYVNYNKSDFEKVIHVPFEKTTICVPNGYDHFLTERYGDYMKLVKGGSLHGELIIDFNVPYDKFQLKSE